MIATELLVHLNTSKDIIAGQCTYGREFLEHFKFNANIHRIAAEFLVKLRQEAAESHIASCSGCTPRREVQTEAELVEHVSADVKKTCEDVLHVCNRISKMVKVESTPYPYIDYAHVIGSFLSEFTNSSRY